MAESFNTYSMTVHYTTGRKVFVAEGFIREGGVYDLAEDGWIFYPLHTVKFIERQAPPLRKLTGQ